MVAFLYYEPIKPFKSYAPLAQLVEQLTLNFACGECGIGFRVRIPGGEVLLAKLAISVTVSPKYVHTLLEWLFSVFIKEAV